MAPLADSTQLSAEQLRAALDSIQSAQNAADFVQDTEALRQLMRLALQTASDVEMLEIFQIKRQEMPEAIKTLQRALERVIEKEREPESPVIAAQPASLLRRLSMKGGDKAATGPQRVSTFDSTSSSSGSVGIGNKRDTLEREFLESGIDALRRMSRGIETNLPSWTITK